MPNALPAFASDNNEQESSTNNLIDFQSGTKFNDQPLVPFREAEVTLESIGNGAVEDRFQLELDKVIRNIKDVNTDAKATREITIKIKFKSNSSRNSVELISAVSSKLAPWNSIDSSVLIGISEDGERSSAVERQANEFIE